MYFEQLNKSNTFSQWITETQKIVSVTNELTDSDGTKIFYANTNLQFANNVSIGGNLNVTGTIFIDGNYDDLNVSGNASIAQTVTALSGSFTNLNVTSNIQTLNTTTALNVGTNANVYGTLRVSQNTTLNNLNIGGNYSVGTFNLPNLSVQQNVATINVTTKLEVGTDATVYGTLNVSGNTTATNVTVNYGNFATANVYSLKGQANTQIYNYIFASNSYTSVQNTLAEFASLTCILG